jgi:hypothetical protein
MPTQVIQYQDATVTVHASVFGGSVTVDVVCRNFSKLGMTEQQFAELIYPAIDAAAKGVAMKSNSRYTGGTQA